MIAIRRLYVTTTARRKSRSNARHGHSQATSPDAESKESPLPSPPTTATSSAVAAVSEEGMTSVLSSDVGRMMSLSFEDDGQFRAAQQPRRRNSSDATPPTNTRKEEIERAINAFALITEGMRYRMTPGKLLRRKRHEETELLGSLRRGSRGRGGAEQAVATEEEAKEGPTPLDVSLSDDDSDSMDDTCSECGGGEDTALKAEQKEALEGDDHDGDHGLGPGQGEDGEAEGNKEGETDGVVAPTEHRNASSGGSGGDGGVPNEGGKRQPPRRAAAVALNASGASTESSDSAAEAALSFRQLLEATPHDAQMKTAVKEFVSKNFGSFFCSELVGCSRFMASPPSLRIHGCVVLLLLLHAGGGCVHGCWASPHASPCQHLLAL